jgi:hypothetical protein
LGYWDTDDEEDGIGHGEHVDDDDVGVEDRLLSSHLTLLHLELQRSVCEVTIMYWGV